jgi:kinetochore protein Spc7/SPC105
MAYLREIELVFDAASFQPGQQQNSRIDLWYVAGNRERDAQPCTPEREFMLQCIRDYVRGLPQPQTSVSRILGAVRAGWDKARTLANQVRLINLTLPTAVLKTSDSSIALRSSLLLVPLQTKVEIMLNLHSQPHTDGVAVSVLPQARVVYGEQFNADKMTEFLASRIGDTLGAAEEGSQVEDWGEAVEELKGRLLARGRK